MYRIVIYGEGEPLFEVPCEYKTLDEVEDARDGISIVIEED